MKELPCVYPNFEKITKDCQKIIEQKYKEYGNSWVNCNDIKFWQERLQTEIDEIETATTEEEMTEEILDAINILCMMWHNTTDFNFKERNE